MKEAESNMLDSAKRLHFVGIGGSGMCPMAQILHNKGFIITGSDIAESDTVERVRSYGIPVSIGHDAKNVGDVDIVVYSAAVKPENVELQAAAEKEIPALERSVVLGMMTRKFEQPVAVAGTHGKTSTTAMLTHILIADGKEPSAIIGGRLPLIGGNGRVGLSETIVVEACEYVDSFLQLFPAVSLILNVDADHLDYFGSIDNIVKSFHKFAMQTSDAVIVNGDNGKAVESVQEINADVITFGLDKKNDYYAIDLNEENTACEDFTLMFRGKKIGRIELSVPGEHNMMNAIAAGAAAHYLGAANDVICKTLSKFSGVHRRFEVLGKFGGITVADDFAHHPTEIRAVLSSAMKMGYNRVWAVFQPHTYSRTHMHMDEFAEALSLPDFVVMSEILAVRETNTYGVETAHLAAKIPGSVWFKTFDEITDYVIKNAEDGDLILTLGGGDVYKCANMFVEKYNK